MRRREGDDDDDNDDKQNTHYTLIDEHWNERKKENIQMQINFTFSIEDWQPIFLNSPSHALVREHTHIHKKPDILGRSCRNSPFSLTFHFQYANDEMNEMSLHRYYHSVWLGFTQHSSAIFHFRLRKLDFSDGYFNLFLFFVSCSLSFTILLNPDPNEYFIIFLAILFL